MKPSANLTLFAHLVARPDADLNLTEAALVIAEAEYPGLDVASYVAKLDHLAREGQRTLARDAGHGDASSPTRLERLLRWMYEDAGFQGNETDYYDPRNSFMNDVLDRRMGIPITLAIVLLSMCQRLEVSAEGVSFPGHFLVRATVDKRMVFIDPFWGRILGASDLRLLMSRATGKLKEPDPDLLQAASNRQILVRVLNNLRGIYASRSDLERLCRVLEQLHALAPSEELGREIEQLGGRRVSLTPLRSVN